MFFSLSAHQITPKNVKKLLKFSNLIFSKKSMNDPLLIFAKNQIFEIFKQTKRNFWLSRVPKDAEFFTLYSCKVKIQIFSTFFALYQKNTAFYERFFWIKINFYFVQIVYQSKENFFCTYSPNFSRLECSFQKL